jgi:toxin ParE1/3/4
VQSIPIAGSAVVQDAEAYQRLLDIAARADAEEGIRQGSDDVAHGRTRPAREFFEEFEAKNAPLVSPLAPNATLPACSTTSALKWHRGLKEALLSLEEHPDRCPVTPEKKQLRHLLYGNKPHTYRVIYRVLEKQKQVEVLHIWHGTRQKLKSSDL